MPFKYNDDKKETGVDVTLEVPGGSDPIPITSVSFSEEAETSEVQFNNTYSQNIAVTGVTYSGSFETAGRNSNLTDAVWGTDTENEELDTSLPAYLSSITIRPSNDEADGKTYTFTNVMITSHSKDMPADDRTTQSFDFSAERLVK